MKTIALSSAVMLGTLTSAAMAEPAATTSAAMAEPAATTSTETPIELLDEQLDEVAGGSASVHGTRSGNSSPRSGLNGTHNTIYHNAT
jgi:hypothetical protein